MTEEQERAVEAVKKAMELIGDMAESNRNVDQGWKDLPDKCMPSLETIELAGQADAMTTMRFILDIQAGWIVNGYPEVTPFWHGFDIDSFDSDVERIMMPTAETN